MATPDTLTYTKTHEWLAPAGGESRRLGITDHAQSQLGDVIFVDAIAVGTAVTAGERIATIESVKAAGEIFAPVAGTVANINVTISTHPELVNTDPYEAGWLFELSHTGDAVADLTAAQYEEFVASEGH